MLNILSFIHYNIMDLLLSKTRRTITYIAISIYI